MVVMPRISRLNVWAAVVGLAAGVWNPGAAIAEVPWFVVVSGIDRGDTVVIDNRTPPYFAAVPNDATEALPLDIRELEGRPFAELLLIFGDPADWADYSDDLDLVGDLGLEDSDAFVAGRFYPAVEPDPPLIVTWNHAGLRGAEAGSYVVRLATEEELSGLAASGVAVRIDAGRNVKRIGLFAMLVAGAGASAVFAVRRIRPGRR